MDKKNTAKFIDYTDEFKDVIDSIGASTEESSIEYKPINIEVDEATKKQKYTKFKSFLYNTLAIIPIVIVFFQMYNIAFHKNRIKTVADRIIQSEYVTSDNYRDAANDIFNSYASGDAHTMIYAYFLQYGYDTTKMDTVFQEIIKIMQSQTNITDSMWKTFGYSTLKDYMKTYGFESIEDYQKWGDATLYRLGNSLDEDWDKYINAYLEQLDNKGGRK